MARNLSTQPGVDNTDSNYVNGKIVDGVTNISEGINQDIIQFFQKLMKLSGLTPNGNPDNEANTYQFILSLAAYIRSTAASLTEKGTVEQATQTEVDTGNDNTRFVTAQGILQALRNATNYAASESNKGAIKIANLLDRQAGISNELAISAFGLVDAVQNGVTRDVIGQLRNRSVGYNSTAYDGLTTTLAYQYGIIKLTGAYSSNTEFRLSASSLGIYIFDIDFTVGPVTLTIKDSTGTRTIASYGNNIYAETFILFVVNNDNIAKLDGVALV